MALLRQHYRYAEVKLGIDGVEADILRFDQQCETFLLAPTPALALGLIQAGKDLAQDVERLSLAVIMGPDASIWEKWFAQSLKIPGGYDLLTFIAFDPTAMIAPAYTASLLAASFTYDGWKEYEARQWKHQGARLEGYAEQIAGRVYKIERWHENAST